MGADTFVEKAEGKDAKSAFNQAVSDAAWECGHGGYTGTIAEKRSFVMIDLPEGKDPVAYANELIDSNDERIDDKWGPAGCIKLEGNKYLFFGWASS